VLVRSGITVENGLSRTSPGRRQARMEKIMNNAIDILLFIRTSKQIIYDSTSVINPNDLKTCEALETIV
jgi:hypothetical protein